MAEALDLDPQSLFSDLKALKALPDSCCIVDRPYADARNFKVMYRSKCPISLPTWFARGNRQLKCYPLYPPYVHRNGFGLMLILNLQATVAFSTMSEQYDTTKRQIYPKAQGVSLYTPRMISSHCPMLHMYPPGSTW